MNGNCLPMARPRGIPLSRAVFFLRFLWKNRTMPRLFVVSLVIGFKFFIFIVFYVSGRKNYSVGGSCFSFPP